MQIGIGLPATIPGADPAAVLEWARRADGGPFSSLGIIDRVVYPSFEPMVALAAAAGATQRIRLMTSILLAPTRNAGILAKQAASLDALSGGRLTLGLGVGAREDDFRAAPAPFHDRGARFEEQLAVMHRIWSGEPAAPGAGPVGPPPARAGGPEVLIGGYVEASVRRVARWGQGFISGGLPPDAARRLYDMAEQAWREAGRPGRPRFAAGTYWALGPDAAAKAAAYITHYYGYLGPAAEQMAAGVPSTPDAVRAMIRAYEDAGVDELMLWPCAAEVDQVDRLADLLG